MCMKSLNMQISAASTSSVGANLPQVSSLAAGLVSHLPEREFSICGLSSVSAQHLLLLKMLDFLGNSCYLEACTPALLQQKREQAHGVLRAPGQAGRGFSCAFIPGRGLQSPELSECSTCSRAAPWGRFWHPELTRSASSHACCQQGFYWILLPLDCWGWGCCAGRMHKEQAAALGHFGE